MGTTRPLNRENYVLRSKKHESVQWNGARVGDPQQHAPTRTLRINSHAPDFTRLLRVIDPRSAERSSSFAFVVHDLLAPHTRIAGASTDHHHHLAFLLELAE